MADPVLKEVKIVVGGETHFQYIVPQSISSWGDTFRMKLSASHNAAVFFLGGKYLSGPSCVQRGVALLSELIELVNKAKLIMKIEI